MAGITFKTRKYNSDIDAIFSLHDGDRIGSVDSWHIGDTVSVMFTITKAQAKAINDAEMQSVRVYSEVFSEPLIHVPCEVFERHHAISWESVGKFRDVIGTSVVLKAVDGYWEDVLLWIVTDKKPSWVEA